MRNFLFPLLLALFAFSCNAPEASPPPPVKHTLFPLPMGQYQVGTTSWSFTDSSRKETLTKDPSDFRRVFVQVFYPSPWDTLHDTLQCYFSDTMFYHGVIGAPLKKRDEKFPVIILSPGFGSDYRSNVTLAEELTSRGFVVFNMGHVFFNAIPRIGNDSVIPFSNDTFRMPAQAFGKEQQEMMARYITIEAADINAVLDRLAGNAPFHEALDTSRIGVCGYSGGGAAASLVCARDRRVKCGVNLNGIAYGTTAKDSLQVPFLYFNSDRIHANPKEVELDGGEAAFDSIRSFYQRQQLGMRARAKKDYYEITIRNSTNLDFSDESWAGNSYGGTIGPAPGHEILNFYCYWFFKNFLLSPDMIRQPDKNYDEVEMLRYK